MTSSKPPVFTGIGMLQSTANFICCMSGTGLVALPYTYSSCGLLLATVLMFVTVLACRFSYSLLLHCRQLSSRNSYEDLAEHALGSFGRQCVRWCEAALNLGTTIAHLNIMADVLSSVAGSLIPPGAEPSRNGYVTGVTLLGALPIAVLVRDPHSISALSTASVIFVFVFAVAVCLMTITSPAAAGLSDLDTWRWEGLLVSFPVFAYGYTAHSDFLGIYAELRRPTIVRAMRVTDAALYVTSGLYAVVGMAGYAQWQARTSGDMLRNLGSSELGGARGAYERALKACYGLAILGCIPLMVSPFYALLLEPGAETGGTSPTPRPRAEEGWWMSALGLGAAQRRGSLKRKATKSNECLDSLGSSDSGAREAEGLLQGEAADGAGHTPEDITPLLATMSSVEGRSKGQPPSANTLSRRTPSASVAPSSLATDLGTLITSNNSPARVRARGGSPGADGRGGGGDNAAHGVPNHNGTPGKDPRGSGAAAGTLKPASGGLPRPGKSDGEDVAGGGGGVGALSGGAPLGGWAGSGRDAGSTYWQNNSPTTGQHAYVVVVVLGVAVLCTNWIPNVEFIMGLTGSSAAVVLSYVLPPLVLIMLMNSCPELQPQASASGLLLLPDDIRRQWEWRKRGAAVLLLFGIVTGVVCTAAVLGAVHEEAVVVQLAQELVGSEVIAQQTAEARSKAQQAVTTVAAVEAAAQRLSVVQHEANSTMDRLNQAAASLSTFTNKTDVPPGKTGSAGGTKQPGGGDSDGGSGSGGGGGVASGWGLNTWVEERKQAAADTKTLKGVEAQLRVARGQVATSAEQVRDTIRQLDVALEALKQEQQEAAQAVNSTTAAIAAEASAGAAASAAGGGGSGSGGSARARAAQLAGELSKALKGYGSSSSGGAAGRGAGGEPVAAPVARPLDQVRANAAQTLSALTQTLVVLDKVADTIASARLASKKDADVRREAALAMSEALTASATSGLALTITQSVLQSSASQEADELVAALTKVASDLQLARTKSGAVAVKQPTQAEVDAGAVQPASPAPSASDTATTSTTTTTTQPDGQSTTTTGADGAGPGGQVTAPQGQQQEQAGAVVPVSVTGSVAATTGGALSTEKLAAIEKAVKALDKASGGTLRAGGALGKSKGGATGAGAVANATAGLQGAADGGGAATAGAGGGAADAQQGTAGQLSGVAGTGSDSAGGGGLSAADTTTGGATTSQQVLKSAVQATQAAHETAVQQMGEALNATRDGVEGATTTTTSTTTSVRLAEVVEGPRGQQAGGGSKANTAAQQQQREREQEQEEQREEEEEEVVVGPRRLRGWAAAAA